MKTRKFTRDEREWELPDAFYRVSIKVIIKDKTGRLLVVKDTTTGTWEIPGGGLDHGETIGQTAAREVKEELGVELVEFDETPIVITPGLHPKNFTTLMLYYWGKISSYHFKLEKKFESKFVDKEAFLNLPMIADEAPIQEYTDLLWPG